MKLHILILVPCFLFSCGGSVQVERHIVSQEEVLAVAQADGHSGIDPETGKPLEGYALWDDLTGKCDVYIVPMEFFEDEWLWFGVFGHEVTHCFEGDYHQ